jgi:hypothetical protein
MLLQFLAVPYLEVDKIPPNFQLKQRQVVGGHILGTPSENVFSDSPLVFLK